MRSVETPAMAVDEERLDFADVSRRLRAIVVGSIGNLVEWYDFYAYAAFALYLLLVLQPERGALGWG